jgi:Arf/Sar family protein
MEIEILCYNSIGALQIYVVDSVDRDRIGVAREEFQAIAKDPLMLNSVVLVLANKQDMVTSDRTQPS